MLVLIQRLNTEYASYQNIWTTIDAAQADSVYWRTLSTMELSLTSVRAVEGSPRSMQFE